MPASRAVSALECSRVPTERRQEGRGWPSLLSASQPSPSRRRPATRSARISQGKRLSDGLKLERRQELSDRGTVRSQPAVVANLRPQRDAESRLIRIELPRMDIEGPRHAASLGRRERTGSQQRMAADGSTLRLRLEARRGRTGASPEEAPRARRGALEGVRIACGPPA